MGRLLQSLPVLRECPQLLQRVALLMEPQVAAEGRQGVADMVICCARGILPQLLHRCKTLAWQADPGGN